MDFWKGNNTIVVVFYGVLHGIPNTCLSNLNCMCCDSKLTRPCTDRDIAVCHRFDLKCSPSSVFSDAGGKKKRKENENKNPQIYSGSRERKPKDATREEDGRRRMSISLPLSTAPKQRLSETLCRCQKHPPDELKQSGATAASHPENPCSFLTPPSLLFVL